MAPEANLPSDARPTAIWSDPQVRQVLDGMTEPFVALDRQGRIAFVNRVLAERRPEGESAYVGHTARDVWPQIRGSQIETALESAFKTGVPARFEQPFEADRVMDVSAYSNGEFLLVHYRDVTDLRRLEQERKVREDSLRAIVDALPHIAWLAPPTGEVIINARWRTYTGTSDVTEGAFWEHIHPEDVALVQEKLANRADGKEYGYDLRLRNVEGDYRWHHVRSAPYQRYPAEDLSWIGTLTDVHEERIKENSLLLLLQVNEQTRVLDDPAAIVRTAMRALATSLGNVRCAYGEIADDVWTILQDWPTDRSTQPVSFSLSGFGEIDLDQLRAGITVRVDDFERERPADVAMRGEAFGARSSVSVPLVKGGSLSAILVVYSPVARKWTDHEKRMIETIASRCWAEVDRARAEATAREREEGLRALVEANPIGVAMVELDSGRVLQANEAWLQPLGLTRHDLESGSIDWRKLTPPDSLSISEGKIKQARSTGSPGLYEKEYFRKDGSRIPVLVGFLPLDGEVKKVTAFMLDLTELRRAEQAVADSEHRYRILAEAIPAVVFTMLPDGTVEYVNSRGEQFFGRENSRSVLEQLGPSIARGEAFETERPLLRADRQYRWHSCRAEPVRDPVGTIVRWIGTLTDIHEAKGRERVLRFLVDLDDATAKLDDPAQAMRETAYMLVGALSTDRCAYANVNDEANIFTIEGDYSRNLPSIVGEYPLQAFGDELLRRHRAGLSYIVSDVTSLELPAEVHTTFVENSIGAFIAVPIVKGGRFVAGMAIHSARPRIWTVDEIDLVEQVAERCWANMERLRGRQALLVSEERLREANDNLEKKVDERTAELQAANDALQGFGYHISHDLRTPLRAIVSTSRIIQADFGEGLPAEANALLSRQAEAARKLGELIDDLLQLSRLSQAELTKSSIDLTALGRDAAAEALSAHPKTEVRIIISERLTAQADPRLLRLAIVNLLENAVKYSPQGGIVRMEQREDGVITITDEGIGMESQYLERIFEPFQRLHRDDAFSGTGIGLANVRRVIDRHGGQVWAESEPGKGSTFSIRL